MCIRDSLSDRGLLAVDVVLKGQGVRSAAVHDGQQKAHGLAVFAFDREHVAQLQVADATADAIARVVLVECRLAGDERASGRTEDQC